MSESATINVGVIGLGFMGANHLRAYQAAAKDGFPCRVVAVSDPSPERRSGAAVAGGNIGNTREELIFDPATTKAYEHAADLLADPSVHLVSICTPTDTHVELALAAIRAGKHVLLEKPVAIASTDVKRVADAARDARTLCMPAMCMRFWPGWTFLRDAVRDNRFGPLRALTLNRLGAGPSWSQSFYNDVKRSGGALVDLHIHDADFVRWCFGDPIEVVSTGSLDHVTTLYRYGPGGPDHVIAEGGWNHSPGFGFRMRYIVVFERATLDFDLGRDPQLLLARDGNSEAVPLEPLTGYDGEVRHVLDLLNGRGAKPVVTMEDAVLVARLLDAERESLQTRRPVRIMPAKAGGP